MGCCLKDAGDGRIVNQGRCTLQGSFQVECVRIHENTARQSGLRQHTDLVPLLKTGRLPLIDLTGKFRLMHLQVKPLQALHDRRRISTLTGEWMPLPTYPEPGWMAHNQ